VRGIIGMNIEERDLNRGRETGKKNRKKLSVSDSQLTYIAQDIKNLHWC
jgi:hypothetical protein